MPLTVNVGLSRKTSKDYQSAGRSINLSAELDQVLLARPEELQRQIAALYQQAQHALDTPAAEGEDTHEQPQHPPRSLARGNGNGHIDPAMTASQGRAIQAIARKLNVDAFEIARRELGVDPAQLSIRDASRLIDRLKSLGQPNGRNGGGR
jgi:CO/xanthine dehydrogenase Mo-binding subunit